MALAAVCVLWGTTYLGIRIALESIPPLYLIAIRYVLSGGILLVVAGFAGARLPRGRELLYTILCGIICIGIGNTLLAFSEEWIPSGLAALFYTTSPFWMVGIDWLLPAGKRPLLVTVGGLVMGLCGVVFLILPAALQEGVTGHTVMGFVILQVSGIGWALGQLLQKRIRSHVQPFINGAVQQIAAGLIMFLPACLFEKLPSAVSLRSELAVGYLVVFGSMVGFSSFIYAMANLPVAIVSIYTFVNPIVAVFLGWFFFREPFGYREAIAMAIIFGGIILVRWSEAGRRSTVSVPAADEIGAIRDWPQK